MRPIANFHNDLLSYLEEDPRRTPFDVTSRASIPQMRAGGVLYETLVIFTKTERGSTRKGEGQLRLFKTVVEACPEVDFRLGIENGSSFAEEDEPLDQVVKRLEGWPISYIGPVWFGENRFGGVRLKEDGRRLLEWMDGRGIFVDLSHASDGLAQDILEFISDKKIVPIASHSNFRAVVDVPRNLPDEIAQEIGKRGGLIGLNFVRGFMGEGLRGHIEHAKKLGLLDHLCFGADFFDDTELSPDLEYLRPMFHEEMADASCFPKVVELLESFLKPEDVEKIIFKNFKRGCHA
jgi:microsomal dipeptidase-like Zn-dependent dipeptidase